MPVPAAPSPTSNSDATKVAADGAAREGNTVSRSKLEGLWWPLGLSAALLVGSAIYLCWKAWHPKDASDWAAGDFAAMLTAVSVADVGQFVSGIAGALVFIWIIFTYSVQREELALQREEMKAQRVEFEKLAGEAHIQSELLDQTAATNKRDAFIRYLDLRERAMALIAADLMEMTATTGNHFAALTKAWTAYERGDIYAFQRALIYPLKHGETPDFMKRVGNVPGALAWVAFLSHEARRILKDAKEIDPDMHRLCFNAPWNELGELFAKLIQDVAEDKPG